MSKEELDVEEKMPSGLTIKSILIGVVSIVIGTPLWTIMTGIVFPIVHFVAWCTVMFFVDMPLLMLFLLSVASAAGLNLTKQEFAVTYAMFLASWFMGTVWGIYGYGFTNAAVVPSGYMPELTFELSEALKIQPEFWAAPPGDHYNYFLHGGGTVPWDLWASPIVFWFVFNMAFQMLLLFIASLLRKQWVDVEDLAFPFGTAAVNLIEKGLKDSETPITNLGKNKWIWIGFIIGFVTTLPRLITVLWPPLGITGTSYCIDLTSTWLQRALPMATLIFWFDPFCIAASYLIPINILLTAVLTWFVFEIIVPPILVIYFGFPFDPNWDFIWVSFTKLFGLNGWDIFYTQNWTWGAFLGLLALVIASEVVYIAKTLKAAAKGNKEYEKGEVFSYRIIWLGIIIFGATFAVLLMVSGMSAGWAIASTIILALIMIGQARIRAETGGGLGGGNDAWAAWSIMGQAIDYPVARPSFTRDAYIGGWLAMNYTNWYQFNALIIPGMEAFNIAKATDTHPREIFIAMAFAFTLAFVIAIPTLLSSIYHWGAIAKFRSRYDWFSVWGGAQAPFVGYWNMQGIYGVRTITGGRTDFIGISVWVAGIALVIIIGLLQRVFPRFPLSAMGVALAGMLDLSWTFFFPWIIALIIKYLTLKIAGVEFYSNKGVPMAIGVIVGWALEFFLENLTLLFLTWPGF
jgi:hypothetical protein